MNGSSITKEAAKFAYTISDNSKGKSIMRRNGTIALNNSQTLGTGTDP
jgi:hypothetical protein